LWPPLPTDLVACELACRYLLSVIRGSIALQYHVALIGAKAMDNPCSVLPVSTKLAQLKAGEKAWAVLRPNFTASIPVKHSPSGIYDLTGGVYLLGDQTRRALHYVRLPSHAEEEAEWKTIDVGRMIIDMGLCVYEHDLIAVVTTTPHIVPGGRTTFDIELAFFEFSSGKPHPQARKHRLHVMNSVYEKPAIGIEIVGDNLVLVLFYHRNDASPPDRVFIYDWRTAVVKTSFAVPYKTYSGLVFLTEDIILLPNTQTNALDIFRIPSKPSLDSNSHLPVLSLSLPTLAEGRTVGGISCRSEPNPIGASSYLDKKKEARERLNAQGQGEEEEDLFPKRGYLASAEQAICIFAVRILGVQLGNFQFGHTFTFVAHRSALVNVLEQYEKEQEEKREERKEEKERKREQEETAAGARMDDGGLGADSIPRKNGQSAGAPSSSSAPGSNAYPDADADANAPSSPSPPRIPWASWGPEITRWFNSDSIPTRWITTTAGQRCVLIADSAPDTGFPYVVLDFNPENVRRMKGWLKARKAKEREPGRGTRERAEEETHGGDAGAGGVVDEAEEAWVEVGSALDDDAARDMDAMMDGQVHTGIAIVDEDDLERTATPIPNAPISDDVSVASNQAPVASTGSVSTDTSSNSEFDNGHDVGIDIDTDSVDISMDDEEGSETPYDIELTSESESESDGANGNADLDEDENGDVDRDRDTDNPLEGPDSAAARRIWCVTTSEIVEPSETFSEHVEGRLPYVACASARTYAFHGVLLDEERVIGIRTDVMDRIKHVEVHHFG
ncbi:hypothetical protein BDZ97DRAFT_1826703, partial [Flammula alnicola]